MVMMMLDSGPRLPNGGDFGCILDLQLLEVWIWGWEICWSKGEGGWM